ncbi:21329_t:CDS:2 [Gigaspora rosea]|nr:21329_t:CDS:2 [Gigaspora rosea]
MKRVFYQKLAARQIVVLYKQLNQKNSQLDIARIELNKGT